MGGKPRTIQLRGVRVHNLKNLDLDLPLGRFIVFAGVSGSGKSSLAFDTLFAEGQRRYIETFSPYTRQFLAKLDKPDADTIDGLPPAIAVSQAVSRRSARSTVGSVTEISEELGLLYARVGIVVCLDCGRVVEPADSTKVRRAVEEIVDGTRYLVTFPVEVRPDTDRQLLADSLREDGFTRIRNDGQVVSLDDGPIPIPAPTLGTVDVVIDRLVRGTESPARLLDSIETAFSRGLGRCRIVADDTVWTFYDGWRCSGCGRDYLAPETRLFRPNSPLGACPECEGFGTVSALDLDRIVPDRSKSLKEGAIAPWTTPAYRENIDILLRAASRNKLSVTKPFADLTEDEVKLVMDGGQDFQGVHEFFRRLEKKSYKMHVRIFINRWKNHRPCPACHGARLRPEALAVKVNNKSIAEVSAFTIADARLFLSEVSSQQGENLAARRTLEPLLARLNYLSRIGLGYLSLDRLARTLSGGEARRVALTSALGSGLVNTLYVLDEPSIGLHPRDVDRLIEAIKSLRDAGNSLVVVEHEESIIRTADLLVEIGPGAGQAGGQVVYVGPPEGIVDAKNSPTGDYLSGRVGVVIPKKRRKPAGWIEIKGASGNNLKSIDVKIPLGVFAVVTGVSGSGKSTLVEETIFPALTQRLAGEPLAGAHCTEFHGSETLSAVSLIDQSPIGRSGRSNPATYLKAFDEIRGTFASTHEAKLRNYTAAKFSFNVEGGRCETCEGTGEQTIDMQFLADVTVRCPECKGSRYRPEVLEITYQGKSIAEALELTAREAFSFFRHRPKVQARLRPLLDVGLEYLRLGQPASTLSGGEAQRLKLASFLSSSPGAITRAASGPKTLFILDEPTTGLHPIDTLKLLEALNSLVDLGHSLLIVEHSLEVMLSADWLIDLGPEAGEAGGLIVAEGTPEKVAKSKTATGLVLAAKLGLRTPT